MEKFTINAHPAPPATCRPDPRGTSNCAKTTPLFHRYIIPPVQKSHFPKGGRPILRGVSKFFCFQPCDAEKIARRFPPPAHANTIHLPVSRNFGYRYFHLRSYLTLFDTNGGPPHHPPARRSHHFNSCRLFIHINWISSVEFFAPFQKTWGR